MIGYYLKYGILTTSIEGTLAELSTVLDIGVERGDPKFDIELYLLSSSKDLKGLSAFEVIEGPHEPYEMLDGKCYNVNFLLRCNITGASAEENRETKSYIVSVLGEYSNLILLNEEEDQW